MKPPKNIATIFDPPAPPKTNFWEGRRKTTTPQQQPNSNLPKKSPQASSSTTEPNEDFSQSAKIPSSPGNFRTPRRIH
ncbi:hypothetical protein TNCT_315421 [Trichonephila clavata]|uniref:Uncharacterized protein n=1 Tax=Trichonephila clavata TaxID=2740835 RepID=A0A8X6I109_TRICU|nr:hypothetical protein TNCT_315421 [Trichonephila clavata]